MWYLVEEKPDRPPAPRYWLGGVGKVDGVSIGRKHVDIRLKASSVSRTHAKLLVEKAPFHAHPHPHRRSSIVSVSDSSAYGTFLKYPKGHSASRNLNAHHIRLDKDKPQQIFDGALLSFGAPAAWWRLSWHAALVYPYNLNDNEGKRLQDVALVTGIDVTYNLVADSTHFVCNTCNPHSVKFLTALLSNSAIVTPAWVEALHLIVTDAFSKIAATQDNVAAQAATTLPEEYRYLPKFDSADLHLFGQAVLDRACEHDIIERRKTLFEHYIFTFARDKLRTKWDTVITLCAGVTDADAQADGEHTQLIHIFSGAAPGTKIDPGAIPVPEKTLIKAIMAADASVLSAHDDSEQQPVAEIPPLIPEPLLAHTDADTGIKRRATPTKSKSKAHDASNSAPNDASPDAEHRTKKRKLNSAASKSLRGKDEDAPKRLRQMRKRADSKAAAGSKSKHIKVDDELVVDQNEDEDKVTEQVQEKADDDDEVNGGSAPGIKDDMDLEKVVNDELLQGDVYADADEEEEEGEGEKDEPSSSAKPKKRINGVTDRRSAKDAADRARKEPIQRQEDDGDDKLERHVIEKIPLVGGHERKDNYRAFRPSKVVVASKFSVREAQVTDGVDDDGERPAEGRTDDDDGGGIGRKKKVREGFAT